MKLLVIRHGVAGSPREFAETGMSDDLRPLTALGRRKMRRNAEGLKRLMGSLDLIGNSPLVRAVETAHIVAKTFGKKTAVEVFDLSPEGKAKKIIDWLNQQPMNGTIALVGHEPNLSELVTWLLCGRDTPIFNFKKGGACLVELKDKIAAGAGQLQWLLTPRQLRSFR